MEKEKIRCEEVESGERIGTVWRGEKIVVVSFLQRKRLLRYLNFNYTIARLSSSHGINALYKYVL